MKVLTKGNYYGSKKSELNVNGIILSEYNYMIEKTDWHFHENPYFMYVLQGDLYDVNKKKKTSCPSGSFLLHNWQEAHFNAKHSSMARGFHIEFERSWFAGKKLNIDLSEGSQLLEDPHLHHLIAKLYFEFKCQDAYSEVSIELLLLQLCENIESAQSTALKTQPAWIVPLKEILHERTENLSLQYLSEQLNVHPVHISRTIPKYLSTTLGDYMRREKIKRALKFLLNSKYTLTEIAYLCGFSDQSHFTRTFKIYFNKTPKAFRKQLFGDS